MRRPFGFLVVAFLLVFLAAPSLVAGLEFGSAHRAKPARKIELATTLPAEIPVLCFHGIGTPSPVPGSVGYYNVTLQNFRSEMAVLASAGYSSITPRQYVAWLKGINLSLPTKPVLITFDDAFWSDTLATSVMSQFGFHAVMFVVTGYADGLYGSEYAPWRIVTSLSRQGWYLQLHAGKCGHAYLPHAPAPCLAGLNETQIDGSHYEYYIWTFGQDNASYEARVEDDIENGQAELARYAHFSRGWQSELFAAPFGAWTNGQNTWLDDYWDSQFKVIFTQQITTSNEPTAKDYRVRYRLELGYQTQSVAYLRSNLHNAAFTRAGATGTVGVTATPGSG